MNGEPRSRRFGGRPGDGTEPAYRRRRFLASHRRRSLAVRLARPFLAAVLLVGVPAMALHWVAISSRFHLREVEVQGTQRVGGQWIRTLLLPLLGRHLLWIRPAEVEELLAGHPWIAEVRVRKELPGRLWVGVSERRPRALLRREGALRYVDRVGRVIAPFEPGAGPGDLLLLSSRVEEPDLAAALELVERLEAELPGWARELSEVEVLGSDDYRLYSGRHPFPLLVSGRNLEEGMRSLSRYLPRLERRYAPLAWVDARFAEQIVVQPAVGLEGSPARRER